MSEWHEGRALSIMNLRIMPPVAIEKALLSVSREPAARNADCKSAAKSYARIAIVT